MSKLTVFLVQQSHHRRNDVLKRLTPSFRRQSFCSCQRRDENERLVVGKVSKDVCANANSLRWYNGAFKPILVPPLSVTSQPYRLPFTTATSQLAKNAKDDECGGVKPLSNKKKGRECCLLQPSDCGAKNGEEECASDPHDCAKTDEEECPKEDKRMDECQTQPKHKKKKKKDNENDNCTNKSSKGDGSKENKNPKRDKEGKKPTKPKPKPKSESVCKPRPKRYRDPYEKTGMMGYLGALFKCGPKQCEVMKKFLIGTLLFYLTSLLLLLYFTDWRPYRSGGAGGSDKDKDADEKKEKKKCKGKDCKSKGAPPPAVEEQRKVEEHGGHRADLSVECVCKDDN